MGRHSETEGLATHFGASRSNDHLNNSRTAAWHSHMLAQYVERYLKLLDHALTQKSVPKARSLVNSM